MELWLNFHSIPHGVVTGKRYTSGFPVCYRSLSNVFAASSGFIHYIHYALKKKRKEQWW